MTTFNRSAGYGRSTVAQMGRPPCPALPRRARWNRAAWSGQAPQIDRPLDFTGILDIGGRGGGYAAARGMLLQGLAAALCGFDDAALTLFDGDAVLSTITFSRRTTSASFSVGQYASLGTLQS